MPRQRLTAVPAKVTSQARGGTWAGRSMSDYLPGESGSICSPAPGCKPGDRAPRPDRPRPSGPGQFLEGRPLGVEVRQADQDVQAHEVLELHRVSSPLQIPISVPRSSQLEVAGYRGDS